jgi:adenine-specific DNA-methyltransferase
MKQIEAFLDRIITGDCVEVMRELPDGAVDLVLTDPPYLSNFRDRTGRSFQNDNPADTSWLVPSYREMYRVLKRDSYCVSFYGFARADVFLNAWREAGFDPVEHMVFVKGYASSEKFIRRYHENAYLLAKGRPSKPGLRLPSVLE